MIGTHSPKMMNARLKQPGARADIKGTVPGWSVCSQNTRMRQKYFSMPSNAADMRAERDSLLVPDSSVVGGEELPDLKDGRVKQVLVPWGGDYIALTPLASAGLAHELWHRLYDRKLPHRKWVIQPTPAARANHGDPIAMQAGALRMLRRGVAQIEEAGRWRGEYTGLSARVEGMNISSGMVALGWPGVTALGGLVHALERKVNESLEFAFGMTRCQWQSVKRTNTNVRTGARVAVKPGYTTDEVTATGDVFLLVRRRGGGAVPAVGRHLLELTRIAGGSVHNAQLVDGDHSPAPDGSYLLDASRDAARLVAKEGKDALDAALDAYAMHGQWIDREWYQPRNGYTLCASGYALLEAPCKKEMARGQYLHAWCEPVFSLVTQGSLTDGAWWRRETEGWGVAWRSSDA